MMGVMTARGGAMHVARNRRTYTAKSGEQRVYESVLVRRTYRDGAKVRHETLANLSALPADAVSAIEATLKGERLVPAGQAVTITAAAPHGHVAAVHAAAVKLGLPALLGPAGRARDLALALIISRVVAPASKLSTLTWWADATLGADLGVADASTDDIYAAMDWLEHRQDAIEAELARRHLGPQANPSRMALFDLSSSWLEGRCCPLAARGYSRDGKKGKLQIEYGLLTDPAGRPVAVRVFPGNTGDPAAFTAITDVVRKKFELAQMVMVGDRGMITSARIAALNQTEDGTQQPDPYGWITALRAPAIRKLMADDGPLQLSLFDEQDLAEITSDDFPGERLIACRNPVLAADRARTRNELLAATEKLLAPLTARVQAGSPAPGRSASRWARRSAGTRPASTSPSPSPIPVSRSPAGRTRSTPRPPWTGSTCCAPRSPPASWTPPPWWPPTRTSNTSSGTSARSRPTTWTCGQCSTGSKNASGPTS